jgi:hypothetical protein
LHWSFPDPAGCEGTWEEKLQATREIRDLIRRQIEEFCASICSSAPPDSARLELTNARVGRNDSTLGLSEYSKRVDSPSADRYNVSGSGEGRYMPAIDLPRLQALDMAPLQQLDHQLGDAIRFEHSERRRKIEERKQKKQKKKKRKRRLQQDNS